MIGKEDQINRLSDNLVIDIDKNHKLLGWKPKFAVSDSLNKMFWLNKNEYHYSLYIIWDHDLFANKYFKSTSSEI